MYDKIREISSMIESVSWSILQGNALSKLETSIEKYSQSIVTMLMDKDLSREEIIKEIEQDNFCELADILKSIQELSYELSTASEELSPITKELQKIESDLLWEEVNSIK